MKRKTYNKRQKVQDPKARRHDGKKAFDNEHDATAAAAHANLTHADLQVPYLCHCGKWHVGGRRDRNDYKDLDPITAQKLRESRPVLD